MNTKAFKNRRITKKNASAFAERLVLHLNSGFLCSPFNKLTFFTSTGMSLALKRKEKSQEIRKKNTVERVNRYIEGERGLTGRKWEELEKVETYDPRTNAGSPYLVTSTEEEKEEDDGGGGVKWRDDGSKYGGGWVCSMSACMCMRVCLYVSVRACK